MQPAEAKSVLGFLLHQLQSEQIITKKIISAIPPDQSNYKRFPPLVPLSNSPGISRTSKCGFSTPSSLCLSANPLPPCRRLCASVPTSPAGTMNIRRAPSASHRAFRRTPRHSCRFHHPYANRSRRRLAQFRHPPFCPPSRLPRRCLRTMGARVPAIYVESADEPFPPA